MANRLSEETSPYLLQHADNPVDWYPWGPEALERAKAEDRPILLSIGYSACHWCHVMAHESFEDDATAADMNTLFVNIKVDREERPDLDRIYQLAHQLLSRRPGGWPLTVMLNPHNQMPFFAGTYFPKTAKFNLPAFQTLLREASAWYHREKEKLAEADGSLLSHLQAAGTSANAAAESVDSAWIDLGLAEMAERFDSVNGGFGGAPKFPNTPSLKLALLRASTDAQAEAILIKSLHGMADGGLFDHVGGGFFRYSVDAEWQIPHFEKMLYDNGVLLDLYADAAALTGSDCFRETAERTAEWLLRDMQHPQGGFYASLDADSSAGEGAFYVWSRDELRTLLPEADWELIKARYNLNESPNFEGHWHLQRTEPSARLSAPDGSARPLGDILETLRLTREQRPQPGRDEKLLTSWNGLAIKGMARVGRLFDRPDFIEAARRALEFIRATLATPEGLLACYKDGRARFPAYLDDYAFLLDAGLELLQSRFDVELLEWLSGLAEAMLQRFEDSDAGGFFFTADDHEALIVRTKPFMDESMPSGNGIAAVALYELGHLLGETRYLHASERILKAAGRLIVAHPSAHATLLIAVERMRRDGPLVILRGSDAELADWRRTLAAAPHDPHRVVYAIPNGTPNLPAALAGYAEQAGGTAYWCECSRCLPPLANPSALAALLAERAQVAPA